MINSMVYQNPTRNQLWEWYRNQNVTGLSRVRIPTSLDIQLYDIYSTCMNYALSSLGIDAIQEEWIDDAVTLEKNPYLGDYKATLVLEESKINPQQLRSAVSREMKLPGFVSYDELMRYKKVTTEVRHTGSNYVITVEYTPEKRTEQLMLFDNGWNETGCCFTNPSLAGQLLYLNSLLLHP